MEPDDPPLSGTEGLADLRIMLESLRTRGLAQRSSALLHNIFAQMKSHPKLWDEYFGTVIAPGAPRCWRRYAGPSPPGSCATTSTWS